jgi:hypothetical protein
MASHECTTHLPVVTINDVDIQQIMYHGRPVVTFKMVALVHGLSINTVRDAFRRNRSRLIEGEDYFHLDFAEASQLTGSASVSPNGEIVLTEDGYLLLVKPLRDDVSWEAQRRMRAAYFALRAQERAQTSAELRREFLIQEFLPECFLPWKKRFPLEYFQQVARVFGQPVPTGHLHSRMMAWFTSAYIYDFLPEDVTQEIKERNPVVNQKTGNRKQKHHQHLKEDKIEAFLKIRIAQLMSVLSTCRQGDKAYFKEAMARHDFHHGLRLKLSEGTIMTLALAATQENQLGMFKND